LNFQLEALNELLLLLYQLETCLHFTTLQYQL
jgi:hypothetical protein